jgi:hypothetical protein
MSPGKSPLREPKNSKQPQPTENAPTPEAPKADTTTDWDEWVEKHGERPQSRSDVADAEGRFRNP